MSPKPIGERLAIVETHLSTMNKSLERLNKEHGETRDTIVDLKGDVKELIGTCTLCAKTLKNDVYVLKEVVDKSTAANRMSGRDKAIIYGSLITAVSSILIVGIRLI